MTDLAIAAIRLKTFDKLRAVSDALTMMQSPIGRPLSHARIQALLQERNAQIQNALHTATLTATQIALATGLSRQRIYAIAQPPPAETESSPHA